MFLVSSLHIAGLHAGPVNVQNQTPVLAPCWSSQCALEDQTSVSLHSTAVLSWFNKTHVGLFITAFVLAFGSSFPNRFLIFQVYFSQRSGWKKNLRPLIFFLMGGCDNLPYERVNLA